MTEKGLEAAVIPAPRVVTTLIGLVILALPDDLEGPQMVRLDATHSVHVADLIGAGVVGVGALMTWATVLAWQRRRIQQ